jgi:hypothetical protein
MEILHVLVENMQLVLRQGTIVHMRSTSGVGTANDLLHMCFIGRIHHIGSLFIDIDETEIHGNVVHNRNEGGVMKVVCG